MRQFPAKGYIADLCCPERKLIAELGGGQHLETTDYDSRHTEILNSWGYRALRYWNDEVKENLDGILEEIFRFLADPHLDLLAVQGDGVQKSRSQGVASNADVLRLAATPTLEDILHAR